MAAVVAPPPKPAVVAPPPKERLSLTYRGMLKRTDGKTLALLEDSKSKKVRFYALGDKVDALSGIRIEEVKEREARVLDAGGSPVQMKFGVAATFEEGRHAD